MTARNPAGGPLAGRVAVVSGGGRGLGRAMALHLAASGARVVVNNRNRVVDDDGRGPADHVVAEILGSGGEAVAEHGDVADPATADRAVALAMNRWGRLDVCVTAAAVSGAAMFHKSTPDQFGAVIAVNLLGTAHFAAASSRVMREGDGGRIILVASSGGLHGEAALSAYATSKGGVIALGRTLAIEGARRGVHTNVVLPYAVTQMTEAAMSTPHAELMDAAAVAPVVTALADPRCTLNGEVIVTAAGALRAVDAVEWGTVGIAPGALEPSALEDLLRRSRAGSVHTFSNATDAFNSLPPMPPALPSGPPRCDVVGHGQARDQHRRHSGGDRSRHGGHADGGAAHGHAVGGGHGLGTGLRCHRGGVLRAVDRGR